ncbi:PREDICTED: uncharacterized protein LOC106740540 isoform X6 [Dinoponera quadriceps]|uniref:Uncharacterized protein LOC106740540 isoform X6 n=1 Tax=Dinoponera quadriceps TaxID=609295 RepID=A0A6P3WN42_DINQU|nr:PREDICTED: uncharacterized protein LOC106740540 isoform X6 [Dinoponera quadriceps]
MASGDIHMCGRMRRSIHPRERGVAILDVFSSSLHHRADVDFLIRLFRHFRIRGSVVDLSLRGLSSLNPEINETLSGVRFVQKRESALWTSETREVRLWLPVRYVIVSQTFTNNCSSFIECSSQMRFIQHYQMEKTGSLNIIYNFLIDGGAYVSRGWDVAAAPPPPCARRDTVEIPSTGWDTSER